MSYSSDTINFLAKKYNFKRYLEIGVRDGATFIHVNVPHKTAVDPKFVYDINTHISPIISYFKETSDTFFEKLPGRLEEEPYQSYSENERFEFDIIFIDGMHTFEQSLNDFCNSIKYIHENSIIVFDDTLPRDPYSAVPDYDKSLYYRHLARIGGCNPWHGDVFKTIFAIYNFFPQFSYATHYRETGYSTTVVWRTKEKSQRKPVFGTISNIATFSYFDMLDYASYLVPVELDTMYSMIGTMVTDEIYHKAVDYSKIVIPLYMLRKT